MNGNRGRTALLSAAALSLAACGASSEEPSRATRPWEEFVSGTIAAAERMGASQEQLTTLAAGEISFAAYEAAVNRSIDCLRDAGIDVVNGQVTENRGFPEIAYSYAGTSPGRTEAETTPIADLCITTHSMFIEALYQESPQVQEVVDAHFERYRAAIIECLRDNNRSLEPDAPRSAIQQESATVLLNGGPDCLREAGLE